MGEIELIVIISVLLLIAPFVSNILKLPIAVVEIMMGSLVGTFGLLHESHLFELLSEVGFLYLMFLAGMEVNLKQFVKIDKKIFLLGGVFLSFLFLLTVVFVKIFHLSNIFIVILPMISVGLIVSVQKEVGKSEWIEMAITVGVIGELLSIILLTVISGIFKLGMGSALYFSILKLIILITILIVGFYFIKVLFWWFPTIKHYIMPDDDKYNQDIRLSFALFFIMISIMIYLHLDVVLGAFVAGMFITSFFEHNIELEHKLAPFGFGFLITLFFIHVGSTFNLKYLVDLKMLKITFLVVALMLGIRIFASFIFIKLMNIKEILLFALSLSMPLTLLIATSTLAYQAKSIDLMHYNAFILASILEVLIAMIGIKQVLKIKIDKNR
jgi:Kef-type K+ transport system membrane component KefB